MQVTLPRASIQDVLIVLSVGLFLFGLLLSKNALHAMGLIGVIGQAIYFRQAQVFSDRAIQLWIIALAILLIAGLWGSWVALDSEVSWKSFWSYQTLGKGILCALAVLWLPISRRQVIVLLAIIPVMLVVRNVMMLAYGIEHSVLVGSRVDTSAKMFVMYRNQADHILTLSPFVLAWALVARRCWLALALLMLLEIGLLASTGWRGAWLGFAGACLVLLVLNRQWRFLAFFLGSLLALGVGAILWSDSNIVAQAVARGTSDNNRVALVWKPVLEILAGNGWQGFGFGQEIYLQVVSSYSGAYPELAIPVFGDAHNMYLNFSIAAGWFGGVAYALILVAGVLLPLGKARACQLDDVRKVLLYGVGGAWLGTYGLLGLTDQPHYHLFSVLMVITSLSLASLREDAIPYQNASS